MSVFSIFLVLVAVAIVTIPIIKAVAKTGQGNQPKDIGDFFGVDIYDIFRYSPTLIEDSVNEVGTHVRRYTLRLQDYELGTFYDATIYQFDDGKYNLMMDGKDGKLTQKIADFVDYCADLYNCSEIEGNEIHYFRVKTTNRRKDRAEMRIKIPPQAMPIAERYFDKLGKRVFRFYRMYACEPNFGIAINLGLKEIGKQVGVERLQFYAARHSWATIARNDLRISKDVINDDLNHVDPSMSVTDVYIRKSFDHVIEANKMVVDYIFSKLPANYQQIK